MPVWHRAMAKDKGEMVEEAARTGIILSDRAVRGADGRLSQGLIRPAGRAGRHKALPLL
ncbi:hypothetical protein HMPREF6485_2629 [Segatella buccae ATCC 33574]|uniref:Uncharacterized protein n=1 Tax=Segatella buccae ATCC 33574 TaxID=873513 RepID=E6KAI1_9BACT|nr:hypothetical protein HMPREF6485_2629 [Segatella buccae ATCC 33574]